MKAMRNSPPERNLLRRKRDRGLADSKIKARRKGLYPQIKERLRGLAANAKIEEAHMPINNPQASGRIGALCRAVQSARYAFAALGLAIGVLSPIETFGTGNSYSATIESEAGSYYYQLTGSGGISYKSFSSSASWLSTTSTRVSTGSGGSWTVNIYYNVEVNTSSSSRTAKLSGTLNGSQVEIAITQSGKNGDNAKHVMTLYRNNSSGDGAGARRTVTEDGYYTLPTISSLGWTRSGYTFKGWATSAKDAAAGRAVYLDGANVRNLATATGATVHLYAIWK